MLSLASLFPFSTDTSLLDRTNTCQPRIANNSEMLGPYALERYLNDRQRHEELALALWRELHVKNAQYDRLCQELDRLVAKAYKK